MKLSILVGSTSQTVNIFIADSSSTIGAGLAGLVFNSAGLTAYYALSRAAPVQITLATLAAVTSAYSSGGFKELDATNMPGWYRLDIPDAALASGRFINLHLKGATNMAPLPIEIELTAWNNQDATAGGISRIDATVSSRMATYTQPTGFLAATFPSVIASTTNITAGTITTTTNLTNLPSIPAGWLTAAGIDTDAFTATKFAADFLTAAKIADGAIDTATFASGATIPRVTLADTLTTYTNNTPQSGDAFLRIGATGSGLTSLAPSSTALSTAIWTGARAGYLDNLNIGGNVASSAEVTSIQNNTRVVRVVPEVIERPDSGTVNYRIEMLLYDSVGNMEVPDSAPTIALVNQSGTDLSARLDSATMSLISTGRYRAVYTASVGDPLEQLIWMFSVVEGGVTRLYGNTSLLVDTTAVDFTSADRAKLDTLHDTRIPGVVQPQTGDSFARIGATGSGLTSLASQSSMDTLTGYVDTEVGAIKVVTDAIPNGGALTTIQGDLDNIQTRLPTALTVGGYLMVDVLALSGDAGAADALETMLDGTGGQTLSLGRLVVVNSEANNAVLIQNTNLAGSIAVQVTSIAGGISVTAGSSGSGGNGVAISAATGNALSLSSSGGDPTVYITAGGNEYGVAIYGSGTEAGLYIAGGTTGAGVEILGGSTSGPGIEIFTISGNGIEIEPVDGHAISLLANGTSKHGLFVTGGTAGTSDGIRAVAGTGGVPIRGDLTGSITGNLSGSVGTVTGNVGGSVVGNVGGNVGGSVGSLAAQAKADVNAEADLALSDINLDHLVKIAVDTDFPTTVHLNSVIGYLADNGTLASFDRLTDSLEAIRDRGDTAWVTGGSSTLTAADVWTYSTRLLSAGTNIVLTKGVGVTGFNDLSAAETRTAVGLAAANLDTQLATLAGYIDTETAAILAVVDTEVAAIKAKTDLLTADVAAWASRGLTMTEVDGAVYRYTTNSLEQAPSGGGGGISVSDILSATVPAAFPIGTVGYNLGRMSTGRVTVSSIIAASGEVTITGGDDYSAADGRAIDFVGEDANQWPDLTGATLTLYVSDGTLSVSGTVVTPTGTQRVRFEPTSTQTSTLSEGDYDFTVTALLSSGRLVTLVRDRLIVEDTEAT